MDKLYSKSSLLIKAACCFLLTPLSFLLSSLVAVDNAILYILLAIIPVGCIYTVPFWLSLSALKKYRISGLSKYIIYDLISCFLPAVFGVLCSEIVYTIFEEKIVAAGIITIIFAIIFLVISAICWIVYYIFYKKK